MNKFLKYTWCIISYKELGQEHFRFNHFNPLAWILLLGYCFFAFLIGVWGSFAAACKAFWDTVTDYSRSKKPRSGGKNRQFAG